MTQIAGPATCAAVDASKHRQCRMPVSKGHTHCAAHSENATPCPHCGTNLSPDIATRHLRGRCPVLKTAHARSAKPWFSPGANLATLSPAAPTAPGPLEPDAAAALVARAKQLLGTAPTRAPPPGPRDLVPEHARIVAAWTDIRDSGRHAPDPKHLTQIAALASLALRSPPQGPCLVLELGAGRAYTAMYVADALRKRVSVAVVVVDRKGAIRNKADRTLRRWVTEGSLASFDRLRVDLADFNLAGVHELSAAQDIRVVAKHVCGAALDLSLTALTRFAETRAPRTISLTIAACCRRLCSFNAVPSDSPWAAWNVAADQYAAFCRVACWGLAPSESLDRVAAGDACRDLVDTARVRWLQSRGWDACVTEYTAESPEKNAIVAVWIGARVGAP